MNFKEWLTSEAAKIPVSRTRTPSYTQGRGRAFGPSGEFGVWQGRYGERPPLEKLAVGAISSIGSAVRQFSRLEPGTIPTLDKPPSREFEANHHVVLPLMLPKDFEGNKKQAVRNQQFINEFIRLWNDPNQKQNATTMLRPIDLSNQQEVSSAQAFMTQVAKTMFWQQLYNTQQLGYMDFDKAKYTANISYYTEPPTITIIMQVHPIQQGAQED
jgi:hypothetical protein